MEPTMFARNRSEEGPALPASSAVVDLLAFRLSRSSARLAQGLRLVRQVEQLAVAATSPCPDVEVLGPQAARKLQTLQRMAMITDHDLYQKWLSVNLSAPPALCTVKSH